MTFYSLDVSTPWIIGPAFLQGLGLGLIFGISIVTTLMTRQAQVIWNELGGHITKYNHALLDYLRPLHLSPTDPTAMAVVAGQIARQAEMAAMLDVFKFTTWSFLAMLPLVFLLKEAHVGVHPTAGLARMIGWSGRACPMAEIDVSAAIG